MSENPDEPKSTLALQWSLCGLFFLGPVCFGAVPFWASSFLVGLLFFLVFFYPDSLTQARKLPRFSQIFFLLVFASLFLQIFTNSMNSFLRFTELLKWVAFACGFLMIQALPARGISKLIFALILLGFLQSVYALAQLIPEKETILGVPKILHVNFATGTYWNRNHLAGLLEMCLGVHLGWWFYAIKQKKQAAIWMGAFMLLVTLIAFFKTGSRSGLVSFTLSFLFFLGFFIAKKQSFKFIVGSLALMFVALSINAQMLLARFSQTGKNWAPLEGRLWVWQDALAIIREFPLWGIGLGSFKWVFPSYQSEKLFRHWTHAHQDYLQLIVELGIPTAIFLFCGFLYLGCYSLQQMMKSHGKVFFWSWGMALGLCSLALHGLNDFNFAIPANVMIFIFILSMLIRLLSFRESDLFHAKT